MIKLIYKYYRKQLAEYLKIFSALGKVKITFFVSVSTALGFILAHGSITSEMILPVLGVFILSCGSSAFNQFQEFRPDALMNRTKHRPIPVGRIKPIDGFVIAAFLSLAGMLLLFLSGNIIALILGILALIWYNLIYTPLKKKTSLAVVPGALIGAIPPAIGWVAGGGLLSNPQIWALSLFFFIWQIPHFWLLLLIYEEDYRRAGFPVLSDLFNADMITKITYVWITALVSSCMLIPLFGLSNNTLTGILLICVGLWLLWRTKNLMRQYNRKIEARYAFIHVNFYVLTVAVVLIADKLF
jgi:protoheme IX farnesyltransferase